MCKKRNGEVICSKVKIDVQPHQHSRTIDRNLGLAQANGSRGWSGMCTKRNGGMIGSKMKMEVQQHQHSHPIDRSGIGTGKRKQEAVRDVQEAEWRGDLLQGENRRPAALSLTDYRS